MAPLLKLRNVEARYGRFVALQNVSLVVPAGAVVALLGPNGVGKSTLLRTVSGMLPPTRGEIWFDGARIDGRREHTIARMGLAHIPEGRGIFPGLTVRENLMMAGYAADIPDGALEHVYELFPVLKMRLTQTAGTLSGGEQQMLSLARAVIRPPKLLMVDELSLGLAPVLVAQLFETLEKIRAEGTAILLVEQYVRYALRLADIVVLMHKGRVAFIGEPSELSGKDELAASYLGGGSVEEGAGAHGGAGVNAAATAGAGPKRKPPARRATSRRSSRA